MSNLIPFDTTKLPAVAKAFAVSFEDFSSGQKSGFPVISVKGKVFHIKRGDEKVMVTKPGADDEPAASIEVIVLKTHPGVAKTYYSHGYTEGAEDKPDCYSNDGVAPAQDAQDAQAKKCAICPHNQWGSRITEEGKKAKACSDVKRLAVAPAGQINDAMLLRIPAASLKVWDQYVDLLKKRGVPPPAVVTKVGFDYTVAYPALTFKPTGFITEEMATEVAEAIASSTVSDIIGGVPTPPEEIVEDAASETTDDKPKATAKAKDKPAAQEADDAPAEKPKATAKAKDKPAPVAEVAVDDDLGDALDAMLGEMGFGAGDDD